MTGKFERPDSDIKPSVLAVEDTGSPFIDKAEAYRRYVQEGLDDIAAGRTRPWEEIEAELRTKYGDFDD